MHRFTLIAGALGLSAVVVVATLQPGPEPTSAPAVRAEASSAQVAEAPAQMVPGVPAPEAVVADSSARNVVSAAPDEDLEPGLHVLVLDDAGAPVHRAAVRVVALDDDAPETVPAKFSYDAGEVRSRGKTSSDGAVHLDVEAGRWRVWARKYGCLWTPTRPLSVARTEAGTRVTVQLIPVAAEARVAGTVVGPDGEPRSGVRIRFWYRDGDEAEERTVFSRANGSFVFFLGAAGIEGDLVVTPYKENELVAYAPNVVGGTDAVLLRLAEPGEIEVELTSASEAALHRSMLRLEVRRAGVWTRAEHAGKKVTSGSERRTWSVEPGPVRMRGSAYGHRAVERELDGDDLPPFTHLVLPVTPRIRGRVLVAGRPAPDVSVRLEAPTPDGRGWTAVERNHVRPCDDSGEFWFGSERTGTFRVAAESERFGKAWSTSFLLDGRSDVGGLAIDVPQAGRIAGRFVWTADPQENSTANRRLAAVHLLRARSASLRQSRPLTIDVAADGTFDSGPLAPGEWLAIPDGERNALAFGDEDDADTVWWVVDDEWRIGNDIVPVTVAAGEVTELVLDPRSPAPHTVRGRLTVTETEPLRPGDREATFMFCGTGYVKMPDVLLGGSADTAATAALAEDGSFVLRSWRGGELDLSIDVETELGNTLWIRDALNLEDEQHSWSALLELGTIRAFGHTGTIDATWRSGTLSVASKFIRPDEPDRPCRLARLPSGAVELTYEADGEERRRQVVVPPGATVEVDLSE